MAKITKYAREQMARALVRHKFNDEAEELCAESAALFNAVLDERYDAVTLKLIRQLEKRQPKAFKKTDDLYLRANGMRVTVGAASLGVHSIARWVPQVAERPVLYGGEDDEPSKALADRIAAFALNTKQFTDDIKTAYTRALGTLEQFTTAKRLTEEWPEALPVIGHLIAAEDRALPVVQLDAINDEFGLPPTELQEAA